MTKLDKIEKSLDHMPTKRFYVIAAVIVSGITSVAVLGIFGVG